MARQCDQCGEWCARYEFSSNQWRKGAYAKCQDCVADNKQPGSVIEVQCSVCGRYFQNQNNLEQHMQTHRRRRCADCGRQCDLDEFSNNQLRRGDDARCIDCCQMLYECDVCRREFRGRSQYEAHRRTHQPKVVPCPGCGKMHRSIADTTSHFETGYCPSCPGRDAARRTVHRFVQGAAGGQRFLTGAPQLTYGDEPSGGWQADGNNFRCPSCQRQFKTFGALMSHQEAKPQCRSGGQAPHLALGAGGGSHYEF